MNSCDNNGVLSGAWPTAEGDFGYGWPDGTKPWDWNGSAKILAQYFSTKEPVNYGQCWVFSGILVTGKDVKVLSTVFFISLLVSLCVHSVGRSNFIAF